jgi:hypothetical protein
MTVKAQGKCATTTGCKSNTDCSKSDYCKRPTGQCTAVGQCTKRPGPICPKIYKPVCGCNGKTYANDCEAGSAGVSIKSSGKCATTSGCSTNKDCKTTEFCAKAEGQCTAKGSCKVKPTACPKIYKPVCGCDGKTYANSCEASAKGMTVKSQGKCVMTSGCSTNKDCKTTEFCAKAEGQCTAKGSCKVKPTFCPKVYIPVCGCDGKTYGNACEASAKGMTVKAKGKCATTTGCKSNTDCSKSDYCKRPTGQCTAVGQCTKRPGPICPRIYKPVCGCDGKTYSNDCVAGSAGASLKSSSKCAP